ncbi:COX15/CtaA family protein [Halobacteriovorax sp.]|uniref:COX15/CtaA family protein n=1 Tax=Halobacteriovorax sp. TaxID=2020862 RepID=UPI003AF23F36
MLGKEVVKVEDIMMDKNRFKKFLPIVIITVFTLIFIGGMVRSTGAGMGCPDWPTCFGKVIPPTSVDQLPDDYRTRFSKPGRIVAVFNPVHTWTEYFNRMAGVWTGIASIILFVLSFAYKKDNKKVVWLAGLSLFLVVLNGGVGAMVVRSHLHPNVITVHMLLTIFLTFALAQLKYETKPISFERIYNVDKYKDYLWVLVTFLVIQVVLGTQVREQIDVITNTEPNLARTNWLERLDMIFYIHRSFSILILLGFSYTLRRIMQEFQDHAFVQRKCISIMLTLIGVVAAGVILAYLAFPAVAQPIHLLFAILLTYFIYELIVILKKAKQVSV